MRTRESFAPVRGQWSPPVVHMTVLTLALLLVMPPRIGDAQESGGEMNGEAAPLESTSLAEPHSEGESEGEEGYQAEGEAAPSPESEAVAHEEELEAMIEDASGSGAPPEHSPVDEGPLLLPIPGERYPGEVAEARPGPVSGEGRRQDSTSARRSVFPEDWHGGGPVGRDIYLFIGGRQANFTDDGLDFFSEDRKTIGSSLGVGVQVFPSLVAEFRWDEYQLGGKEEPGIQSPGYIRTIDLSSLALSVRFQQYLYGMLLPYIRGGVGTGYSALEVGEYHRGQQVDQDNTTVLKGSSSAWFFEAAVGIELLLGRRWRQHGQSFMHDFTMGWILEGGRSFWSKMDYSSLKPVSPGGEVPAPTNLGSLDLSGWTFNSGLVIHF